MAISDTAVMSIEEGPRSNFLESVKGAKAAVGSKLSSIAGGMIPDKETRDAMNDGKGMNDNDRFYLANKWGAALMFTAGVLSGNVGHLIAGGGAFYANNLATNKKQLWEKEALGKLAADDPRREVIAKLGSKRADLRSDWVKLVCHGAQLTICGTAAVMGAPAIATMGAIMGGAAVTAYGLNYARSFNTRTELKKELKEIEEKYDLGTTELDERSFVRENFERIAGQKATAFADGVMATIGNTYAGKILQSTWEKATDYTSSAREMVLKTADNLGKQTSGYVLFGRGVTSTAKGVLAIANWDVATAILTLSGASYTAGGVFKIRHDGKAPNKSDVSDEIAGDEKGTPPLPRVATIYPT